MEKIEYQPIGLFHCAQSQPVDSPRQGALAKDSEGYIELNPQIGEDCLQDLAGFDRFWIIYDFHLNKNWKPKVRPPRGADKKRGVLATRSPYRPNSIGVSCVRLSSIQGRRIFCTEHDLLDQTPILDIKPYVLQADCFPDSKQGWLEGLQEYSVEFEPSVLKKIDWIEKALAKPVQQTIIQQLSFDPTNSKIKRVKSKDDFFVFHYRTWKVFFSLKGTKVQVFNFLSNYSVEDLQAKDDPYQDKKLHIDFQSSFDLGDD